MQIIGILNTKGGSGKTTLTSCLSVRAADDGTAAVVDLDPQASYSDWFARRPNKENPTLLKGADHASDAVERLQLTSPYDYVFLDGPPGSLLVTEDAIKTATLVVIPMRPSPLDIGASRDAIELCQEHKTPFLVVINGKGPHDGKLVEQAQKLLASWKVRVAETVISHRTAYMNAITTGRTGAEKSSDAKGEVDGLWQEVKLALAAAKKARAA